MILRTFGLLAFTLALAGCGATRRSAITVEVTSDVAHGTATVACRASTSGVCHAVFLTGNETKTADAATGASVMVDGLAPGTRFCVAPKAPDAASCKSDALVNGHQIVRREHRETD